MKHVVANHEFFSLVSEELNLNKEVSFKIKGNSMLPFLRDGITEVFIKKQAIIKKLDVILFKYHDKYLMHRVIKIKNNLITCQGDGLLSKEVINEADVMATMISFTKSQKTISVTNKGYLFKVKLWRLFRPLRRILLKVIR